MAQKKVTVTRPNGDERMVSVVDTTKIREVLQQCHVDDVKDRHTKVLRGVTLLKPDMTVSEAGLEDGDEISILRSDPFVEMASWTGEAVDQPLYVRIPDQTTCIYAFSELRSFRRNCDSQLCDQN